MGVAYPNVKHIVGGIYALSAFVPLVGLLIFGERGRPIRLRSGRRGLGFLRQSRLSLHGRGARVVRRDLSRRCLRLACLRRRLRLGEARHASTQAKGAYNEREENSKA